jgi:hypothetical protein
MEPRYTVHEKELLALVDIVNRHSYWLLGVKFTISTDHKSLQYLQTQTNLSRRQARWIVRLQDFDYMIVYIKGVENSVADLLSRSTTVQPKCRRSSQSIQ